MTDKTYCLLHKFLQPFLQVNDFIKTFFMLQSSPDKLAFLPFTPKWYECITERERKVFFPSIELRPDRTELCGKKTLARSAGRENRKESERERFKTHSCVRLCARSHWRLLHVRILGVGGAHGLGFPCSVGSGLDPT